MYPTILEPYSSAWLVNPSMEVIKVELVGLFGKLTLLVKLATELGFPILFQIWYVMLPVAEHTTGFTVTRQLPDLLLPSVDVAVIVAVPADTPVTSPLLLTAAMAGLLEVQLRVLLVALSGDTVARSNTVPPIFTDEVEGKLTEETGVVVFVFEPRGDRTDPGIISEGPLPVCPGLSHPTARQSPP